LGQELSHEASLADILKRPTVTYALLTEAYDGSTPQLDADPNLNQQIQDQVEISIKYAGYIDRQALEIARQEFNEGYPLPDFLDYSLVRGLSKEVQQKLGDWQIPGVGVRAEILELGVAELGLALSQKQVADLNTFLQELERWNRVHNLTSVEGDQASIDLHLIDSIAILPIMREFLPPTQVQIADLGSGGGLPAIPIAIAEPNWSISLIEAVRKKTAFLQNVKGKLGLGNASIYSDRVEHVASQEPGKYDAVISRAFTSLDRFLDLAEPFLKPGGLVFAMKAKRADEELLAVSTARWRLVADRFVVIPNSTAERRLLVFTPHAKITF
jgi:16S rRNA (guanine527-N7)-methyltransferase